MDFEKIKDEYNEEMTALGIYHSGVNHTVMTNTEMMCLLDEGLKSSINYSVRTQYMVKDEESIDVTPDGPTIDVTVEYKRTFEAAVEYKKRKSQCLILQITNI